MICEIDGWVLGGVQLVVQMLLGCAVWGAVCGAGDGAGTVLSRLTGCFGHAVWGALGAVGGVRASGGAVRGAGVQSSACFWLFGVYAGVIYWVSS